jgi:hypothetical protein
MVRSRLSLTFCLAVATLFVVACSSTTVVARDDRATTTDSSAAAEASDETQITIDDDSAEDPDEGDAEEPADTGDIDRGARDDSDLRTPRELVEAAGFGLGGAEQLDSLFTDCEGGMDLACDILLLLSAFESIEENAALTCGGRSDSEVGFCTSGLYAQPDELVFKINSEGLGAIVTACEVDADMTACDFLYYRSPLGSDLQEIGGSCGGRVGVAVPDCRTLLGE